MLDNNHKILMDCDKFYVMHDVTQKPLLVHRAVEILLAYLNFYAFTYFYACGGFHSSWLIHAR